VLAAGIATCAVILAHANPEVFGTALILLIVIAAIYFAMRPKQIIPAEMAESLHE